MHNLAALSLLALAPLLIISVLLVVFRWPAKTAMPVGYVAVVLIAAFVWHVEWAAIAASTVQGIIVALTLLYIVFGALLLLETLTKSGAMSTIRAQTNSVTDCPANWLANGDDVDRVIADHALLVAHVQIADAPGRHEPGAGGNAGWVGLAYKPIGASVDSFDWLPRARRSSMS